VSRLSCREGSGEWRDPADPAFIQIRFIDPYDSQVRVSPEEFRTSPNSPERNPVFRLRGRLITWTAFSRPVAMSPPDRSLSSLDRLTDSPNALSLLSAELDRLQFPRPPR